MEINGKTTLYGIMGNPVGHSLSPAMHNAAFAELGLNSIYVPFPVQDVAAALNGFKALHVRGVSVTIPHKQLVMPLLDKIDPMAAKIGAVNTLLIDDEAGIKGFNTDWLGANRALGDYLAIKDKKIMLMGAGGAARAIGFGLLEAGAEVVLVSRTKKTGEMLAAELGCEWHPLADIVAMAADALINATSAGMTPNINNSPVPEKSLVNFPVVMDIVYSPLETRLLREATTAGCKTINGLTMLLYQGVAQFELWTGINAPLEVMKQKLITALDYK